MSKANSIQRQQATEAEYISILAEVCKPEDWREILENTVQRAKEGDDKALNFLAKHLIGKEAPTLVMVQAWQQAGHDPVEDKVKDIKRAKKWDEAFGNF